MAGINEWISYGNYGLIILMTKVHGNTLIALCQVIMVRLEG